MERSSQVSYQLRRRFSEVEQCPGLIALALSLYADAIHEGAQIAEAKGDTKAARAPIRLMTQFLRAVSENRMEDALALAQTILTFEPENAVILDYQTTLALYINNERELKAQEDGADGGSTGDESSSTADENLESGTEDVSTEGPSGDEALHGHQDQGAPTAGDLNCGVSRTCEDEQEEQRLGGVLRDLRQRRVAGSQESASRWNEEKFAANRREVETVLWGFLPEGVKQAAEKRAQDDASAPHDHK